MQCDSGWTLIYVRSADAKKLVGYEKNWYNTNFYSALVSFTSHKGVYLKDNGRHGIDDCSLSMSEAREASARLREAGWMGVPYWWSQKLPNRMNDNELLKWFIDTANYAVPGGEFLSALSGLPDAVKVKIKADLKNRALEKSRTGASDAEVESARIPGADSGDANRLWLFE